MVADGQLRCPTDTPTGATPIGLHHWLDFFKNPTTMDEKMSVEEKTIQSVVFSFTNRTLRSKVRV